MRSILVPVDFNKSSSMALEKAMRVASRLDAEIVVLHVLESGFLDKVFNTSKSDEKDVENSLKSLVTRLSQKRGISIRYVLRKGNHFKEIERLAAELDALLIIMGAPNMKSGEIWLKPNRNKIISTAPCPVLTVRDLKESSLQMKKILVPIDESRESLHKMQYAIEIGKLTQADIFLLGVCSCTSPQHRGRVSGYMLSAVNDVKAAGLAYHKETILGKAVSESILDYSMKIEADLLVIMSEQNTEADKFLLGPFVQQIVNYSRIPVLTVRDIHRWCQGSAASKAQELAS